MRNPRLLVAVLPFVVLAQAACTRSTLGTEPVSNVIETFAIDGNGDFLVVPVTIAGNEYRFMVDTGMSTSVCDPTLRHLLIETGLTVPVDGTDEATLLQWRDATVGRSKLLMAKWAMCLDLAPLLEDTGLKIQGIIGTDFLKQFTVQIDFDHNELRLLKSAEKVRGTKLQMGADRYGSPTVMVQFPGLTEVPFLIDTGLCVLDSGELSRMTFETLRRTNQIQIDGSVNVGAAFTSANKRVGTVALTSVGKFDHRSHYFHESVTDRNILGLGYLSRYLVTLDFPRGQLYLERGKRFDTPSIKHRSDLHIGVVNGELKVLGIDEDGIAYACGIRRGDQLLEVDGLRAAQLTVHAIDVLVCRQDRSVAFKVKSRDDVVHTVQLRPEPFGAPSTAQTDTISK